MRAHVLIATAAGAIGAALLAATADQAVETEAALEQHPARSSQAAPSQPSVPDAVPASAPAGSSPAWSPPKRARVPAGVLVRAATRRAHEREAAIPAARERRRGREKGDVLSVEIDWHAGTSADR